MMSHLDPHINQFVFEVQKIIHFPKLANQLPSAFINKESEEDTCPKI